MSGITLSVLPDYMYTRFMNPNPKFETVPHAHTLESYLSLDVMIL
jgi:hypothetical protein